MDGTVTAIRILSLTVPSEFDITYTDKIRFNEKYYVDVKCIIT